MDDDEKDETPSPPLDDMVIDDIVHSKLVVFNRDSSQKPGRVGRSPVGCTEYGSKILSLGIFLRNGAYDTLVGFYQVSCKW